MLREVNIMDDMKEAQWFILIAGFMMLWMVMVMFYG